MIVNVHGATISDEEKDSYIKYLRDKYPGRELSVLDIFVFPIMQQVRLCWQFVDRPFDWVRRDPKFIAEEATRNME